VGRRRAEPLRVKTQAIDSATEAATMILRIDDVLSSKSAPAVACHPEHGWWNGRNGRNGLREGGTKCCISGRNC